MSGTKQKLGSEQVKRSIGHFIREARICAETEIEVDGEIGVLGFAAMLTIFPVMNSISEAILSSRKIEIIVPHFIGKMSNSPSWLIKSPSCVKNDESIMVEIRNGLVHAMSLPPRMLLTKNITVAREYMNKHPGKYDCIIGIEQFIDEVERTAYRLVNDNPDIDFDPLGTKNFGSVDLISPPSDYEGGVPPSASGMGTR
jgi:hypothetical protein